MKQILSISFGILMISIIPLSYGWNGLMAMDADKRNVDYGDIYYDLAKMYGGILMSYRDMKSDDNISLKMNGNEVEYSYVCPSDLWKFKSYFEKQVSKNYDMDKIKKITSLIFLNMAPLHSEKFGDMLFFKSLKMLNEIYK